MKKAFVFVLTATMILGLVGCGFITIEDTSSGEAVSSSMSLPNEPTEPEPAKSIVESYSDDAASETENETMTVSQQQAIRKANEYLSIMSFSQSGLASQLEYEGFPAEDAVLAVESIDVDWNEQAAKKAAEYLEISAYSRQGLIDQLIYEGFTDEQAAYGVDSVGL